MVTDHLHVQENSGTAYKLGPWMHVFQRFRDMDLGLGNRVFCGQPVSSTGGIRRPVFRDRVNPNFFIIFCDGVVE